MKIQLLKTIDSIIGKSLVRFLPPPRIVENGGCLPLSILVIRPGGIGDAVLLIPAIRALRARYPDATINILAEKRNCQGFALSREVARVFCYDRPREFFAAVRGKYDAVIDSEQWHRLSALIARLAAKGTVVGYATNERVRAFTHPVSYSHADYEIKSFFHLLEPFGIVPPDSFDPPFLDLPDAARQKGEDLLASLEGNPYVVLFPGASIPERRWGGSNFRALALRLKAEGVRVVVVGGAADRAVGEDIAVAAEGLNLAGYCSLVESAAVIAGSSLLVSGDSGILHIGVGLGVPTVSLFGPGISAKWAPRGEAHRVITRKLPCSPCTRFGYTPPCPRNGECISAISVEEVWMATMSLLSTGKKAGA